MYENSIEHIIEHHVSSALFDLGFGVMYFDGGLKYTPLGVDFLADQNFKKIYHKIQIYYQKSANKRIVDG